MQASKTECMQAIASDLNICQRGFSVNRQGGFAARGRCIAGLERPGGKKSLQRVLQQ
jgi:hypothetical protein